jgi:O-antigen/teichoic acid export membrane protein
VNRQYFRDTASLVGARLSNIVLGILVAAITSRWLGPEGKGELAILSTIASLVIVFGHLGIGDANLFHIGTGKHGARRLLDHSAGLGMALGGLYFLLAWGAFSFLRPAFLSDIGQPAFVLALVTLPFTLTQKYVFWVILGMKKSYLRWIVNVLEGALRLALIAGLVLAGGMSVEGVLGASLVVAVVSCVTATALAARETGVRPRLDRPLIAGSIGFGLMPYLVYCVMNLILRSDVFLVKSFLTTADVGLYSVGTNLAEKIWILPEALAMALFAQASREQAPAGGPTAADAKRSATPQVVRFSAFCTALGCVALIVFAPWVVLAINGPRFEASIAAFRLLMPGVGMMAIYQLLNADLTARKRSDITLTSFLVALVLNVGLNLYLIPRWGIEGAAFSSSVAYATGTALQAVRWSPLTATSLRDLLIVKAADPRGFARAARGLMHAGRKTARAGSAP